MLYYNQQRILFGDGWDRLPCYDNKSRTDYLIQQKVRICAIRELLKQFPVRGLAKTTGVLESPKLFVVCEQGLQGSEI